MAGLRQRMTAWPEGPGDYEAWLGLNPVERWEYVRRLEDAVVDLALERARVSLDPPPRLVAASRFPE
jgi:hypothetical protein